MTELNTFFGGGGSLQPQIQENTDRISEISNPNLIINGDFSIDQRNSNNAVNSSAARYVSDRMNIFPAVSESFTTEARGAKDSKPNLMFASFTNFSSYVGVYQAIETTRSKFNEVIKNGNLTVSFCSANDNETPIAIGFSVRKVGSSEDGRSYCFENAIVPSVSADNILSNKTAVTIKVPAVWKDIINNGNEYVIQAALYIGRNLSYDGSISEVFPLGTGSIRITNFKVEVGNKATPFIADDPATNLAKCQRYYWTTRYGEGLIKGNVFVDTIGETYNNLTTIRYAHHVKFFLPVEMRQWFAFSKITYTFNVADKMLDNIYLPANINSGSFLSFRNGHAGNTTVSGDMYASITVDAEL